MELHGTAEKNEPVGETYIVIGAPVAYPSQMIIETENTNIRSS